MMKRMMATALLALTVLAADAGVFAASGRQFEMYAFLVTIDQGDNRGDVVKTIKGAGSILDLVSGRDPEDFGGGDIFFNRWVLNPSLIPGAPEIPAIGIVGINKNVPAAVRNEYSQNSALWFTIEFGNTSNVTREQMRVHLRSRAGELSATHIWEITPGDNLSAGPDLRSRFVPRFNLTQ